MSAPRTRVCVVLPYGLGEERWRALHREGETRDATPYGYDRAADRFDMVWTVDHAETRVARRLRGMAQQLLNVEAVHVWRNRRRIAAADVVWTHTEREHLPVAFLRLIGVLPRSLRIVGQTVWLWDEWSGSSRFRRTVQRLLLRHLDVELVHSASNQAESRHRVPGRAVLLVPFSTAAPATERATTPDPRLVLAPGNDVHRDWEFLARVAERLPEHRFLIASGSAAAARLDGPANLQVTSTSAGELRALYATCGVVALPLKPNLHASGATVALESIALGAPLVVSDEGGIGDYVEGAAAELVPGGDVDAFVAAIESVRSWPRPEPGDTVLRARGLTQEDYVLRYALVTRWLVDGEPVKTDVEGFHSVVERYGAL
jgi:glycosyltransferase involved in cell wall biosynthesis